MKKGKLQFALALLILPLLSFAYGPSEIDGFYADRNGNNRYQLEANPHGLLLKADQHGVWTRFERASRNQFVGPRGQRIVILDHGTLKLKKRHETITLRKTRRGDRNRWRYNNDHNKTPHRNWTRGYDNSWGNGHYHRIQLDGTWYAHNGQHMDIDQYKNGLSVRKGRHHHDADFYHRVQSWDRLEIFRNDYGDTITVEKDGDLTWRGRRGHRVQHYHRECR
jgi:hypothetical protein